MRKFFGNLLLLILPCVVLNTVNAQSFSGKTHWSNTFDISSYVSSSVKLINVINGQKVKKNDPLLVMDNTILKLDYEIAKAELVALEPNKEQADMDFNRALELYDRTLISDVTLKNAEFKFVEAKAKYDAASAELEKSKFLMDSAIIKSPINGRILHINTTVGFYSDREKAKSLITLVDDTKMFAIAYLKVSQWSQSLIGKKATVLINKKSYQGTVESLSLLPIDKSNGISIYPMAVTFNPKNLLPEGMPLTINIE